MARRSKDRGFCEVEGCGEPAHCAGLCKACYSGSWYWAKRGIAARMTYRKKLLRLEARMELMDSNILLLRRKRG